MDHSTAGNVALYLSQGSRIKDVNMHYSLFFKLSKLIGGDIVAQKDIRFNRLKPNMNFRGKQ